MKIKWKARFMNPLFWAHVIFAIFVPILTHYGYDWSQITTWPTLFTLLDRAIENPAVVVAVLVSVWNCIFDPTTKGLADGSPTQAEAAPIAEEAA